MIGQNANILKSFFQQEWVQQLQIKTPRRSASIPSPTTSEAAKTVSSGRSTMPQRLQPEIPEMRLQSPAEMCFVENKIEGVPLISLKEGEGVKSMPSGGGQKLDTEMATPRAGSKELKGKLEDPEARRIRSAPVSGRTPIRLLKP